jgi:Pyruvate/2-oxoacid:ferredoxin oxidoreductase delta subunit
MLTRKIVHIDQQKCDGCGQCVPSCAEGAIRIVKGKASLVSDAYCDGLGACLGQCPRDAISIVEREASPFDERAAHAYVAAMRENTPPTVAGSGCPGAAVKSLRLNILAAGPAAHVASGNAPPASGGSSRLANWPLQLHLVPPNASFLRDADVLLVADCVPVAHPDFHRRFLNGRPVLMGCPKLDNATAYVQKLAQIIRASSLRSISVLHMEVPCCTGLLRIAEAAVALAGGSVPIHDVTVAIDGRELTANMQRVAAGE